MSSDFVSVSILLGSFFGLIFLRIPISLALILSCITTALHLNIPLVALFQKMVNGVNSFTFLAIPFFIITGEIMTVGGISDKLIKFADVIIGKVRGGFAMVNVLASMLFGGISGSSVADVSSIGSFLIPIMVKKKYGKGFSVAVTVSSSVQGIIIPPSQNMIYYALAAGGLSISQLFLAGYIPGLIFGVSLMLCCYVIAVKKNFPKGKVYSLREGIKICIDAMIGLFTVIIIIGGILFGIFTATESAAVAAIYAIVVVLFVYKSLKPRQILTVLFGTLRTLSMIIAIIGASSAFAFLLAWLKVPILLTNLLLSISQEPILVMLMINFILLILGMLVDIGILILLLTPIFLPVVTKVGYDPIHFCIIMMISLGIGLCTPPVGTSLYVGCSIGKISIENAVKDFIPFYLVMLIVLLLVIVFPQISMWLPSLVK